MNKRKCVIGKTRDKNEFLKFLLAFSRATNVNCTGKTMPVGQSTTSFCTNRQDGRYASETYCNVFHHCSGGTDNLVRCTGELQWDDRKKECGWESTVRCGLPKKMLPNENKFNSTFCTGKADG
jgi:hypothetical protein